MAPTEYSLSQAFKRIEEELIKSMIRNFEKHKAEELEEGFNWDQWQVVQLRELENYRRNNLEKFGEEFDDIHGQLRELLEMANEDAQTEEEARILDQILKGNLERAEEDPGITAEAFGINEKKLGALIDSTTNDLAKAEHAVLRRSNDIYRKVIYDAQVYAANGGTYEQAVDMATKDFVKRGITSIVYKNGSRHTIQDYARMAIRTAHKRAYLMGEGKKHAEYGIHTVRVAKRSDACPLCLRWTGKVLIDDVYGGGTKAEAREKRLPLLSTAMKKGFLHPNCKDVYSLYIEGVSKPADPWTEYELRVLADKYNQEEGVKHAEIMAGKWQLVADTRLDEQNKREAEARVREWKDKLADLSNTAANSSKVSIGLYEDLIESLKKHGVQPNKVTLLTTPLSEYDIINKVAGPDQTGGSCVSVALAYLGNKAGYDVLDFRGGVSRDWFLKNEWLINASNNWFGVKGKVIYTTNDFTETKKLLATITTPGKEYILSAGAHAAIVRKTKTGYEYLELQSTKKAGWRDLDDAALIDRFGCADGLKESNVDILVDTETLMKAEEFKDILPYINTSSIDQMKGRGGGVK